MASYVPVTLSREILKWIQSLDLAYSVKNAKRDFANGFLVAEIFSRYYDKDIQMHSFDNGHSTKAKQDNWAQLLKFFRKRNIQPGGSMMTNKQVEAIIHCRAGSAIAFVTQVYEFLSLRKVQQPPNPPAAGTVPPFAKPTASTVLRDTLKDPEFQISDTSLAERKMRETLDMHEKELQAERAADPQRFSTTQQRAPSKVLRGQTRTVGAEESKATVTVKKVNVKHVDTNVAQLRASKAMHASASKAGTDTSMGSPHPASLAGGGSQMGSAAAVAPYKAAFEVFNRIVTATVNDEAASKFLASSSKPAVVAFVDLIRSNPDFPEAAAIQVFEAFAGSAADVAGACLANANDYWLVHSTFYPLLLLLPEHSSLFGAVLDFFMTLGDHLLERDDSTAQALMSDFGIKPLCDIMRQRPQKRQPLLSVIYSFTAPDISSHVQMIRLLQETLNDVPTFVSCLTSLIFLEETFDADLLDVYMYYCQIGLTQSSPVLRAASIGMLSVLAVQNPRCMDTQIAALQRLVDDPWWEVRAQIVVVCSIILDSDDHSDDTMNIAYDLIMRILMTPNPAATLRIALTYLSKAIASHAELRDVYINVLLSLPVEAREGLLNGAGDAEELPLVGSIGHRYSLAALPEEWPSLEVALAVADHVQGNQLEHMELEHFQVLCAALRSADLTDAAWNKVFQTLQDHIFVAMCDPGCCEYALEVIRKFMFESSLSSNVLQAPTLVGSILLLHQPSGGALVQFQAMLADLLMEATSAGHQFRSAILALLKSFYSNGAAMYNSSPLAKVGEAVQFRP